MTLPQPLVFRLACGLALALAAAGLARAADAPAPAASAAARPALAVVVVQPQAGQLATTVAAHGNLAAWQEASVGTEANGLRLAKVNAAVGDRVKRGQVLAEFAPDTIRADLAALRAQVAETEATLAEAAANARRARELQETGALSAQQIQQYLTAERTAQARLEAMRASAQVQQLRLKQTQVLAPDDGIISARSATLGAVMPAGQELFRLIRQGRLEWRAEVPASELIRLKPGMAVTITPAGGPALAGTVRMVAPTVDAATRNGLVYVDLKAPGEARAGMFARGEFELGRSAALTLPQGAVVLRDGFSYVFKVGADNRLAMVKVAVGRRQADRVEITSGLDAGARVVAAGAGFLADGDLVRVVAK
jgi:HlyD family secretion protein